MPEDTPTKTCSKCRETMPVEQFGRDKSTRSGRKSACKLCRTASNRTAYAESDRIRERQLQATAAWRAANLDRIAAKNAEWRAANYDRQRAASDAWKRANPERVRESERARYAAADPEKRRRADRAWAKRNPEKLRAGRRSRYVSHREKDIASTRAWQRANPERVRELASRRRARERSASVGIVDYAALLEIHGLRCYLCGMAIDPSATQSDPDQLHMDHVVPLARGGAHSMDNIRPAHSRCNLRKGSKLISELDWITAIDSPC